eukprot:gnl/Dysnectes_brevis/4247_a5624_957.p1 GENE.gnl/Dysnectes_brevis/4247_a5624_957~~gnl/Dysnectes_brevis/4247_a5624_957.p1  ORF type:complete len:166 (-),score=23.88 gnl/Dysnectes_brevis/4247_a5624_957:43-540(-)
MRKSNAQDDLPMHEKEPKRSMIALTARDYLVDLQTQVGKHKISDASGASKVQGFVCKVCGISFMDSAAYLTHINSEEHQRNMGVDITRRRHVTPRMVELRLQQLADTRRRSQSSTHGPRIVVSDAVSQRERQVRALRVKELERVVGEEIKRRMQLKKQFDEEMNK